MILAGIHPEIVGSSQSVVFFRSYDNGLTNRVWISEDITRNRHEKRCVTISTKRERNGGRVAVVPKNNVLGKLPALRRIVGIEST